MNTHIIRAGALTLAVAAAPAVAAEKVNIGAPAWTGAQAIAHLIAEVVTTRIGGEANLVPGNNASIFQAMDQGKGDIDVHPDVWLPNQQSFTNKYVDGAGTVELSTRPYEGKQSFCVPKAFSEQHDVKSVFDLARPEVAKLMDSDGNGKGEIWIGAPGWASANVNEVKVRDYGLLPFMEPVRADQAVMTATVGDRIRKDIGYAFYCYSPHAIWFQYDIVRLEEPPFNEADYVALQPSDDPDWYEKSRVMTEDALKKVQIAWSKSLAERSPAIYEFLERYQPRPPTTVSPASPTPGRAARASDAADGGEASGWRPTPTGSTAWLGL